MSDGRVLSAEGEPVVTCAPETVQGAVAALGTPVAIADRVARIAWANDAFLALFDGPAVHGTALDALFAEAEPGAAAGRLDGLVRTPAPGRVDLSLAGEGAKRRWFAVEVTPLTAQPGLGAVLACHEVTRLKEEIGRLDAARAASEARNQAKSRYLAMLSHEIRTPINGILGMARMLADSGLVGEQRGFAQTVEASGESLLCLVNDILDLSKIEVGKLELHECDFDLGHVIESVVGLMAGKAREKSITVEHSIDAGVATALRGDPGRVRQILLNLVGNAVKFTDSGAVQVRATGVADTPTRQTVRLDVIDSGIGVDDAVQPHLFNFYQQADPSIAGRFGGTGLGLAISKTLVEMMGGRIGVQSHAGGGSTFWFTIPFAKQRDSRGQQPWRPPEVAGLRILLIDDNPADAQAIHDQLTQLGIEVTLAGTGEDGFAALLRAHENDSPFDAVISDQTLPGASGEQIGGRIRARPEFATLPLAMITSSGMRGDAQRVREIGFDAYLTKPVSNFVLAECVRKLVRIGRERVAHRGEAALITAHAIREGTVAPPRVLLVEDNKVNQMLALTILLRAGYEVDAATTGREALAALGRVDYDIVLMDLQMPEMDGMTALAEIRKLPGRRGEVPVVAVTAHAMRGTEEACLAAGMNDYVAKPFMPETLLEVVGRNLAARRSDGETPEAAAAPAPDAPAAEPVAVPTEAATEGAIERFRRAIEENDLETLQNEARSAIRSAKRLW